MGAEQGRRARGLVIYRLAALLWCSGAVARERGSLSRAMQAHCFAARCDNHVEVKSRDAGAWQRSVGAERGSGASSASLWSRERSRELSRERSRDAELVAWSHIYRLAAMLWCSGAVGCT